MSAIEKKNLFLERLQKNGNVWGHSSLSDEAKKAAMAMLSTKTGMYAGIPILCKEERCPYSKTCDLYLNGLTDKGQKCSWECAIVETRYAGYTRDFDLDSEDVSYTDQLLIVDLIKADVMIERATRLAALDASPVKDVVVGMSEDGSPIMRPEISKAVEALEKHQNLKYKILDLMNGTRKARKNTGGSGNVSMSQMVENIIQETEFIIEEKPAHL